MIRGVAIAFGLVAMGIISVVGGWFLLVAAHAFVRRYHALLDYLADRKTTRNGGKATKALLVLFGVLLVGCTTVYVRPFGVTEAQFERDSYACERDRAMLPYAPPATNYATAPLPPLQYRTFDGRYVPAAVSPSYGYDQLGQGFSALGLALAQLAQRNEFYERCMESKGYRKEE